MEANENTVRVTSKTRHWASSERGVDMYLICCITGKAVVRLAPEGPDIVYVTRVK